MTLSPSKKNRHHLTPKTEAKAYHARARCKRSQAGVEQHVRNHHNRSRPLFRDLPATGIHIYVHYGVVESAKVRRLAKMCEGSSERPRWYKNTPPSVQECLKHIPKRLRVYRTLLRAETSYPPLKGLHSTTPIEAPERSAVSPRSPRRVPSCARDR